MYCTINWIYFSNHTSTYFVKYYIIGIVSTHISKYHVTFDKFSWLSYLSVKFSWFHYHFQQYEQDNALQQTLVRSLMVVQLNCVMTLWILCLNVSWFKSWSLLLIYLLLFYRWFKPKWLTCIQHWMLQGHMYIMWLEL